MSTLLYSHFFLSYILSYKAALNAMPHQPYDPVWYQLDTDYGLCSKLIKEGEKILSEKMQELKKDECSK